MVSATNDYDSFINAEWKHLNPLPADQSNWTSFHLLSETVNKQLEEICTSQNRESLIGFFYDITMTIHDKVSMELSNILSSISQTHNMSDLLTLSGLLFCAGSPSFFHICKGQDDMEPTRYIPHVIQGGYSLPDREYYLDANKLDKFKSLYLEHITKLASMVSDEILITADDAVAIFNIETSFAELHHTQVQKRDPHIIYNKLTWDEFTSKFSSDWNKYWICLDLPQMNHILVDCPNFYDQLTSLLNKYSVEQWKKWLSWKTIKYSAPHETDEMIMEHFRFWGTVLTGQTEIKPRWKRAIAAINNLLGEELGKTYVSKYFPADSKKYCLSMVNNLKDALRYKITNIEWMSPATKAHALEKLDSFSTKIGYPDKWLVNYDLLQWQKCKNIQQFLQNWSVWNWTYEECAKFYTQVEAEKWHMPPQAVNAYYNPCSNEIVFPAGILQEPFYSPSYTDEQNLGGIGVIIGHEMTHGFDYQGRKYNSKGELKNWWTETDSQEFEKRAQVVEHHFDSLLFFGEKVNGKLTLCENIADIGGLKLALHALNNMNIDTNHKPDLHLFFKQYATMWRSHILEQAAHQQLNVDPHSPAHYRINAALSHIPEFHSFYQTAKEDNMYRHPDEMMTIW